ncbi:unnamed protein product, partial [Rotaria magnacalcarata]
TTIDGLNNDNVDKSVSSGTTTPLTYTKATSEASSEYETEEDVLKKKLFIQSKKHFGGAFVNI